MTISLFGKNFNDLLNVGRTFASQMVTTGAKTLEATAAFLGGVADRLAAKAPAADEAENADAPAEGAEATTDAPADDAQPVAAQA